MEASFVRAISGFALAILLPASLQLACQVKSQPTKETGVVSHPQTDSRSRPQSGQSRWPLKPPLVDPQIVVAKSKRQLDLYSDGAVVRTYRVGLGFNPVGDKEREGDGRTPEGEFYVFTKNERSAYYLSLGVSYPNAEDAERGLRDGLIKRAQYGAILTAIARKKAPPQYTPLGGLIYIHGHGSSQDWTLGCVALENEDIRELFAAVSVGTPVIIKP